MGHITLLLAGEMDAAVRAHDLLGSNRGPGICAGVPGKKHERGAKHCCILAGWLSVCCNLQATPRPSSPMHCFAWRPSDLLTVSASSDLCSLGLPKLWNGRWIITPCGLTECSRQRNGCSLVS